MARPSFIDGKKDLRIRVSKQFYNFLKEMSTLSGITISELCRSALETWFMVMYLGKLSNVEKEFKKKYRNYFKKISLSNDQHVKETHQQEKEKRKHQNSLKNAEH